MLIKFEVLSSEYENTVVRRARTYKPPRSRVLLLRFHSLLHSFTWILAHEVAFVTCLVTHNRSFGFTDSHSGEGKRGIECRGQEHEIELVWSINSDKVRILWNKRNIPLYHREKKTDGEIDVSWESTSGKKFRIFAHESPTQSSPQYDLFINDASIFSLPHVSELLRTTIIIDNFASCDDLSETSMDSTYSESDPSGVEKENRQALDTYNRLSAAASRSCDPLDDDLTSSSSFTNILEFLRRAILPLIPDSEDMVSRSIINALSEDKNSYKPRSKISSKSSLSRIPVQRLPTQIESNLLYETIEWADSHLLSSHTGSQEQKRLYMQKQMDSVFLHVRNERLNEDEAARIIFDMATLLDYPVSPSIKKKRDTIILRNPKSSFDLDAIINVVSEFGELHGVGISSNRTFGKFLSSEVYLDIFAPFHSLIRLPVSFSISAFCRFASEIGPIKVLAAADKGCLIINGRQPIVSMIQKPSVLSRPNLLCRRAISTPLKSDLSLQKPILRRRRSHQRNTISIDTLMVESPPFLRMVNETSTFVSPLSNSSFVDEDIIHKFCHTKAFDNSSGLIAPVP